jgi:hypothetical protein
MAIVLTGKEMSKRQQQNTTTHIFTGPLGLRLPTAMMELICTPN